MPRVVVIFNDKNIMSVMCAYLTNCLLYGNKEYYIHYPDEPLNLQPEDSLYFIGIVPKTDIRLTETVYSIYAFLNVDVEHTNKNYKYINFTDSMLENMFIFLRINIIPNTVFHFLISTHRKNMDYNFKMFSREIVEGLQELSFFSDITSKLLNKTEIQINIDYNYVSFIGKKILSYKQMEILNSSKRAKSCKLKTEFGIVDAWYCFERRNKGYLAEFMQEIQFPNGNHPSLSIVISYNFKNKCYDITGCGYVFLKGKYIVRCDNMFKTCLEREEFLSMIKCQERTFLFPIIGSQYNIHLNDDTIKNYIFRRNKEKPLRISGNKIIEESNDFTDIKTKTHQFY